MTSHRTPQEFYDRTESLRVAEDYLRGVVTCTDPGYLTESKFRLFGSSGIKGIGKTEFLKQCAITVLPRLSIALQKELRPVYITFNGRGTNMADFNGFVAQHKPAMGDRRAEAAAVGHLLLRQCGDEKSVFDFKEAVKRIRGAMGMADADVLVVLVDEIGELGDDVSLTTIKALMSEMDADAAAGKLVFVFTHILHEHLTEVGRLSGRRVCLVPLPAVDIAAWNHLQGFTDAAKKHAGLMQLCLSCCGHPRAIFDGLREAAVENPTLLSNPTPAALITARDKVVDVCKFLESRTTKARVDQQVSLWFKDAVIPGPTIDTSLLVAEGLLHRLARADFFFPLGLQRWATALSGTNSLAFHLQQAYAADATVGRDSEKYMERIMYHYEAVLRAAVGAGPVFPLQQYYKSSWIDDKLSQRHLKFDLPTNAVQLHKEVQDFSSSSMPNVLRHLELGYIVVSKAQGEEGVEYFAPFRDAATNALVVACVQCKFVQKSANWAEIADKMMTATTYLKQNQHECFPVVYTTVDQQALAESTFAGGVYFTETELFEFTRRLGVLRLHKEKLGAVAQDRYPFTSDTLIKPFSTKCRASVTPPSAWGGAASSPVSSVRLSCRKVLPVSSKVVR